VFTGHEVSHPIDNLEELLVLPGTDAKYGNRYSDRNIVNLHRPVEVPELVSDG
jgi:hypothetical protein